MNTITIQLGLSAEDAPPAAAVAGAQGPAPGFADLLLGLIGAPEPARAYPHGAVLAAMLPADGPYDPALSRRPGHAPAEEDTETRDAPQDRPAPSRGLLVEVREVPPCLRGLVLPALPAIAPPGPPQVAALAHTPNPKPAGAGLSAYPGGAEWSSGEAPLVSRAPWGGLETAPLAAPTVPFWSPGFVVTDSPLFEVANVPTASSERLAGSIYAAVASELAPAAAQRIVQPEAIALPVAELPQPPAIHTDVLLSAAIRAARAEAGPEPAEQVHTSPQPDAARDVSVQSPPSDTPSGRGQAPRADALAADLPRDRGVGIPPSAEWVVSGTNEDAGAATPLVTDGEPRSAGDSASAGRIMVATIPRPGSGPELVGASAAASSDSTSAPAPASDDAPKQPSRPAEATAGIPGDQPQDEEPSERLSRMWSSLVDDDVVVTRHTAGGQARPSLQVAAAPAEDALAEVASTPTREGAWRPTEPPSPSPPAAASEPTSATRGAAAAEAPRREELTSQADTGARPAAGDVPASSGSDRKPPVRPVAQSDAPAVRAIGRSPQPAVSASAVTRGIQGATQADLTPPANSVAVAPAATAVRTQATIGQDRGVLRQPDANTEPVPESPGAGASVSSAPRTTEMTPPDSARGAFDTYAAVRDVSARPNPPAPPATMPGDSAEMQAQASAGARPQSTRSAGSEPALPALSAAEGSKAEGQAFASTSGVARAAGGPTDGDGANPAASTTAPDVRAPAERPAQVAMPTGDHPAQLEGRTNAAAAARPYVHDPQRAWPELAERVEGSQPAYRQAETPAFDDNAGRARHTAGGQAQPATESRSSDQPLPTGTRNEPSASQALAGETDVVNTPQQRRVVGPTPARIDEAPEEQLQPQPQPQPTSQNESKQATQDAHAAREIARPDAGPIAANIEGHAQREAAHLSPAPPPTAPQVIEQIARAARVQLAGGHAELAVRLDPPTLGTVHMRVVSEGGAMTAHLQVSTEASRELLSANLPALKEALAAAGLDIGRVSVGVGHGTPHQQDAATGQPRQPHWHDQRLTAQADNGGGSLAAALRGAAHAGGRLFDAFA